MLAIFYFGALNELKRATMNQNNHSCSIFDVSHFCPVCKPCEECNK